MKPWWQSRTMWFNFVSGVVLIGTELGAVLALYPAESPIVTHIQMWLPMFNAIGNLMLRVITNKGVHL